MKSPLILSLSVVLLLADTVPAQTFKTLHTFIGSDGANSSGPLMLSGNTLYGMANGGTRSDGTIFALNTDGSGFTNLYTFHGTDGNGPQAGCISGTTIYATTHSGGSSNYGTIFSIQTDGSGFTILHSLEGPGGEGAFPNSGLVLVGGTLYGTAAAGGRLVGSVFAVSTNGTGFTNLHEFGSSDGITPLGGLGASGSTLYGTTQDAGPGGFGTVFRVDMDGSSFSVLHAFGSPPDGITPVGGLVCLGGVLYGAASFGGEIGEGVVFSVDLDGSNYTNVINFNDITSNTGALPSGPLIASGNSVLGATSSGGNFGGGTVFSVTIDGLNYRSLYDFTLVDTNGINKDGVRPSGQLVLSGNTLYGVTLGGGSSGKGTIFSVSLAPELKVAPSVSGLIITWPTNVAGFDYSNFSLQSATSLVSPVWTAVSVTPARTNGNNIVTNPIPGTQQFFRLVGY